MLLRINVKGLTIRIRSRFCPWLTSTESGEKSFILFISVFRVPSAYLLIKSLLESTSDQLFLFWSWLTSWLTASQSLNFDLFSSLLDCYIILANSLHSIQSLFRPVPISLSLFTLDLDWMHSPTIVLKHVEALSCCNVLFPSLIIWITFK